MNHQDEIARKIVGRLQWGTTQLEPAQIARLQAARERAVASARVPVAAMAMAGNSGGTLRLPRFSRKTLFLLTIISIVGLWAAYSQWSQDDFYDNVGELDAQLLTGELPINAFLDKDFDTWVKESSE